MNDHPPVFHLPNIKADIIRKLDQAWTSGGECCSRLRSHYVQCLDKQTKAWVSCTMLLFPWIMCTAGSTSHQFNLSGWLSVNFSFLCQSSGIFNDFPTLSELKILCFCSHWRWLQEEHYYHSKSHSLGVHWSSHQIAFHDNLFHIPTTQTVTGSVWVYSPVISSDATQDLSFHTRHITRFLFCVWVTRHLSAKKKKHCRDKFDLCGIQKRLSLVLFSV